MWSTDLIFNHIFKNWYFAVLLDFNQNICASSYSSIMIKLLFLKIHSISWCLYAHIYAYLYIIFMPYRCMCDRPLIHTDIFLNWNSSPRMDSVVFCSPKITTLSPSVPENNLLRNPTCCSFYSHLLVHLNCERPWKVFILKLTSKTHQLHILSP